MDDLEVRELRYFVAVAEELNFTKAAARLRMAQPPLSKSIQAVERKLGVVLLTRSPRGVELTEAGYVLYQHARIALDAVSAAGLRAARAGQPDRRLVVAVKPGPDVELLHEIRAGYEESGAGPRVHLAVGGRGEQLAMLHDGRADVAVYQGVVDQLDIDYEVLRSEPRIGVLPPRHPLANQPALHRTDLLGEAVPTWPGASPVATAYMDGVDHFPPPFPLVPRGPLVGNIAELLEVVAHEQAVAFVPSSTREFYPAARVVYVPVLDLSPSNLVVAWPRNSRSHAVGAFVRTAVMVAEAAQSPTR
jgi:DNA-binding transcriptional LysR family regulator